jgi:steroid 5-alpha reductase family enzyme
MPAQELHLLPCYTTNINTMTFFQVYFYALVFIIGLMSVLWIISVIIKNVSIVDLFWGFGFVLTNVFYFISTEGFGSRKTILLILVSVWGLRLSGYLAWRNIGKGEDYRYKQFRIKYGEKRYWWISFFQTFLLQGILMWLISIPLLGAQYFGPEKSLCILDYAGIALWIIGFIYEAGGDYQLAVFKSSPSNKGKVLSSGFWRYTRHPNYFGDSSVWWAYGLICLAAGSILPVLGSLLMTALIIKVSGVTLLEKTLKDKKPEYKEYIEKTSAFFPWFPKK